MEADTQLCGARQGHISGSESLSGYMVQHKQVAKGIFFDPVKHEYYEQLKAGRRIIDGVTHILKKAGKIRFYGRHQYRNMMTGSEAHDRIRQDIEGTLVEELFDDRIMPFVHAFRDWREKYRPRIIAYEKSVYHPGLDYCGTLDLLAEMPDERRIVLIDYKTGYSYDWHKFQLAGYLIAEFKDRWLKYGMAPLYLSAHGTYRYEGSIPIAEQMAAGAEWLRMARAHSQSKTSLWED